jgi:Flp pilus assembly pilin Flp
MCSSSLHPLERTRAGQPAGTREIDPAGGGTAQGSDGRDHNQYGFTIWMAGAGVKSGFRYGETDEWGWEHLPSYWASSKRGLGPALESLGGLLAGAEGLKLLAEAVDSHRQALLVLTKEHLPEDWANTHLMLRGQERGPAGRGSRCRPPWSGYVLFGFHELDFPSVYHLVSRPETRRLVRPLSLLEPSANFLRNEDGLTALEYAGMLAVIIIAYIGLITIRQRVAHATGCPNAPTTPARAQV